MYMRLYVFLFAWEARVSSWLLQSLRKCGFTDIVAMNPNHGISQRNPFFFRTATSPAHEVGHSAADFFFSRFPFQIALVHYSCNIAPGFAFIDIAGYGLFAVDFLERQERFFLIKDRPVVFLSTTPWA